MKKFIIITLILVLIGCSSDADDSLLVTLPTANKPATDKPINLQTIRSVILDWQVIGVTTNSVTLNWQTIGSGSYIIYRNKKQVATTESKNYTDGSLDVDASYDYLIQVCIDNTGCSVDIATNSITLNWQIIEGINYIIYRDERQVATTNTKRYTIAIWMRAQVIIIGYELVLTVWVVLPFQIFICSYYS